MSGRGEGSGDAGERRGGAGRRVHFEALVAVGEAAGGAGFEAESVDVSPEGMRLRAAYLPEVGERLLCRFDGPGGEITLEGEVCWRREEPRGGEFGLRFDGLDPSSDAEVRALCASIGGGRASAEASDAGAGREPAGASGDERAPRQPAQDGPGRGARVRLHIEGLGSPMKARVRDGRDGTIEVGSNLEFLKVGRSLDLEDVDRSARREAFVDEVRVEIDPGSSVPQLVVTLRYDDPARAVRAATARRAAGAGAGMSAGAGTGTGTGTGTGAGTGTGTGTGAGTGAGTVAGMGTGTVAGTGAALSRPSASAMPEPADDSDEEQTPAQAQGARAGRNNEEPSEDADASPALAAADTDETASASPPPSEAAEPASAGGRAAGLRAVGSKAAAAGRAVAGRVGPALSGAGARARGAMAGILARIQQKRAERDDAKKSSPRRMTAPPPAGALRSDGRRLVRDGAGGEDAEGPESAGVKPRVNKKAAALGSFLGLAAVLAVFGAARMLGLHGGATPDGQAAAPPALPPGAAATTAAPPAAPATTAGGGTLSANVPLFGATPLSTTEPVPPPAPPADPAAGGAQDPLAAAAEAQDDPAAGPGGSDEEPSLDDDGKVWGQGDVRNPTVLKLKMDGEIGRLSGASGPMGFTVSLPDRRALSSGSGLARKDKRIASIRVVNTPQGAEVTLQFKDGTPPYLARAKGDRLEIALGNEAAPKKVAAKGKSKAGKKGKDDGKKGAKAKPKKAP